MPLVRGGVTPDRGLPGFVVLTRFARDQAILGKVKGTPIAVIAGWRGVGDRVTGSVGFLGHGNRSGSKRQFQINAPTVTRLGHFGKSGIPDPTAPFPDQIDSFLKIVSGMEQITDITTHQMGFT